MELAVIKTGGKQYVVSPGAMVTIEKIGRGINTVPLKKGDTITFDEVLMTDDGKTATVGTPMLEGKTVTGTVQIVGRAKKIDVVKYKAKSRYLKRRGHRQPEIKVKIDSISK
ncbi:MAG: ribosomal protein L21 [Parcubacteria bacterium C7867-004]|nr:MAG: ribosomal protein L21 [Parcubacteria bacterium C7867-004]